MLIRWLTGQYPFCHCHIFNDARSTILDKREGPEKPMFDRFIEHDTDGIIKGLTLEWKCPKCEGMNFKILLKTQRESGQYHSRCRYCKAKFLVNYPSSETVIEGEAEFMERLTEAEFFEDEEMDLIRDFAEIEYLKRDGASPKAIREKQNLLEDKITFYKRRRRL